MDKSTGTAWHAERSLIWVVAVMMIVLAIYWQTAYSMIDAWRQSTTYSHGFLILPIFLWLVWNRRPTLSRLSTRPWWLGLLAVAAIGLVWLIGSLAAAAEPSQFAAVALVPAAVATILGKGWVRALAFPFAFLFFAVPFGNSLIPPMMDWTADFTVAALKLSGVPVYRAGNDFSIPSGDWSVIEACSGIRYVFACLTVSTLYAWTVYRGTVRRLVFIGAALATVVVANWIRAFSIVMLAHLSDNQRAVGIDHMIYGGVFFVAIMAALFSLGALWREKSFGMPDTAASQPPAVPTAKAAPAAPGPMLSLAAAFAVAATLVVWPLLSAAAGRVASRVSAPLGDIAPRAGWLRVDEPVAEWKPQLRDPSRETLQTFGKDGKRVSVYLGVFDHPTPEAKVTASANQLVGADDLHWKQVQRGIADLPHGDDVISIRTGTLVGRGARVIVWHWYWVDGTMTTSPTRAALLQVLARVRGRSEMSALVAAYTIQEDSMGSEAPVLAAFLPEMLGSIDDALRQGE